MNVGEKLKQKRIEKGYTQEELAKVLGINRTTIAKYESNRTKRLTADQLQPFCEVLGCNLLWLMGMTELDGTIENVLDAIEEEDRFYTDIRDACLRYNGLGRVFDRNDYEEIINYIKFKAMQKG